MCNLINFNWCIYPWNRHHDQGNKRVYHPPRLPHAPLLDSIFNQGEYTHKVFPILPASENQIAKKSISEPYLAFIWTRWINTRNLLTMHSWEYKKSVFKLHLQRRHFHSKLYLSQEVLDYLKDGNWKVSNHTLKGPWFSSLTGLQISQKLNEKTTDFWRGHYSFRPASDSVMEVKPQHWVLCWGNHISKWLLVKCYLRIVW